MRFLYFEKSYCRPKNSASNSSIDSSLALSCCFNIYASTAITPDTPTSPKGWILSQKVKEYADPAPKLAIGTIIISFELTTIEASMNGIGEYLENLNEKNE